VTNGSMLYRAFVAPSSRRILLWIVALGIAVRIGLFVAAFLYPITNENNHRISGAIYQKDMDIGFCGRSSESYFSANQFSGLIQKYFDFYGTSMFEPIGIIAPGPVYPTLLKLFDYQPGNTLPLSLFFVAISVGFLVIWLGWLYRQQLPPFWLLAFALLPHPLWYMLNMSTDVPFAFLVAVFFVLYFRNRWDGRVLTGWLAVLVLIVLTRPNGCSFLAFCFLDVLLFRRELEYRRRLLCLLFILGVAAALFYYPYLVNEIGRAARLEQYTFFGLRTGDYRNGIFDIAPLWLDRALSMAALFVAKLLYFVGLRPSYGDASIWLVAGRALPGLILLPGLIHLFWRGDRRLQLLTVLYLLPILLAASQDRYSLPLQPVLLYQCALLSPWMYGGLSLRWRRGESQLGKLRQE